MSANLAQAASSGEAVLLIGGLVVALILLGTALARSAGALAGVAVEAARAGLSAVGGLLAVLALL
ncbi:MAG: hypothetical protein L0K86_05260, partial [Actinomycetia bacterium]|nr:hypothetical protein [Actinomycetes bacterium]